ncbi:MAG: hypothetical protein KAS62_07800, partial [Candidatus Delongbacteria bacterium]|nr:hypothetical protein [Candidatus Delongbacteria bacterium]
KLSEDRIVASTWQQKVIEDGNIEVKIDIFLLDNNLNKIKSIYELKENIDRSFAAESQYYPFFCGNSEEIFLTWVSTNEYKIDVYDSKSGNKKYQIKKNYKTYFYSDIEMDRMSELNKIDMKKEFGNIKKRAINEIFMDKYNRLWVLGTKDRTKDNLPFLYADIFVDGIYQKTFEFKDLVYYDGTGSKYFYKLRFVGDKTIYFNADEFDDEKGRSIKVFDY